MDSLSIVASTAEPAFATDEQGRIVIWNKGAERHFGYEAASVLGKPCQDILCGRDIFGNRYCGENCTLIEMGRRHEPIRRFEMEVLKASGERVRMAFSIMLVPGPRRSQFTLIHVCQPLNRGKEVDDLLLKILAGAASPAASSIPESVPVAAAKSAALTSREIEVLRLIAEGISTSKIADSLYISVATVRNHTQNILRKLDAHSKLEAVSLALRNRLV